MYRDASREREQLTISFMQRIAPYQTQMHYFRGFAGKNISGPVFLDLEWDGLLSNTGSITATIKDGVR